MASERKKKFRKENIGLYFLLLLVFFIIFSIRHAFRFEPIQVISYDSINSINSLVSILLLTIFIFVLIYYYLSLTYKLNEKKNIQFYDFRAVLFGDGVTFLEDFYDDMIDIVFQKEASKMELDSKFNDNDQGIDNYDISMNDTVNKINLSNQYNMLNYLNQQKSTEMNLNQFSQMISDINEKQEDNKKSVKQLHTIYSRRIQKYVESLIHSLDIIRYQINISYVTPTLHKLVVPLSRLYDSIYQTMTSGETSLFINRVFGKEMEERWNNEIPKRVKPLETVTQTPENLSADFTNANKILEQNKRSL